MPSTHSGFLNFPHPIYILGRTTHKGQGLKSAGPFLFDMGYLPNYIYQRCYRKGFSYFRSGEIYHSNKGDFSPGLGIHSSMWQVEQGREQGERAQARKAAPNFTLCRKRLPIAQYCNHFIQGDERKLLPLWTFQQKHQTLEHHSPAAFRFLYYRTLLEGRICSMVILLPPFPRQIRQATMGNLQ